MSTATHCKGCGAPISPTNSYDNRRKWCSERCRKRSYGDPCVDCGARTCYGAETARIPEPRCQPCSAKHRVFWTREVILARIEEWADLYGEPPAVPDWCPSHARKYGDEPRAKRFEDANGHWPAHHIVYERFPSWNAAIAAAGYTPRAPHGGGDNVSRRRNVRRRLEEQRAA